MTNSRDKGIQSLKNPIKWQVNIIPAYFTNYGPFKPDCVKYWRLAERLVTNSALSVKTTQQLAQVPILATSICAVQFLY